MSAIRPFRGLRPRPEHVAQVASPPYDVLDSDEARELVKNNPRSFLRVNKPEVDFPSGTDIYCDEVYERGRRNLRRLIEDGIMCRDESDCLYLYRLTMAGRSQTGLVALTSVEEYLTGRIKKHEHTRPEKVKDRADHIMRVGAQVGPVLSVYRRQEEIRLAFTKIVENAPVYDFLDVGGVRHEMWVISDPVQVDGLVRCFAKVPELYVADGHHRTEAAAEVARRLAGARAEHEGPAPASFFLNVLFSDDELRILPYNRVIRDLNAMPPTQLLEKAQERFAVLERLKPVIPIKAYHYGMYLAGEWYELVARPGTFDADHPSQSIDSAVLSANFLVPILGIADIRTDERIDFVGGSRGVPELERLVDSGAYAIAFVLYPASVEQLLRVADAGEVMPPKSTWFEPKLRSGMVVNLLDDWFREETDYGNTDFRCL